MRAARVCSTRLAFNSRGECETAGLEPCGRHRVSRRWSHGVSPHDRVRASWGNRATLADTVADTRPAPSNRPSADSVDAWFRRRGARRPCCPAPGPGYHGAGWSPDGRRRSPLARQRSAFRPLQVAILVAEVSRLQIVPAVRPLEPVHRAVAPAGAAPSWSARHPNAGGLRMSARRFARLAASKYDKPPLGNLVARQPGDAGACVAPHCPPALRCARSPLELVSCRQRPVGWRSCASRLVGPGGRCRSFIDH